MLNKFFTFFLCGAFIGGASTFAAVPINGVQKQKLVYEAVEAQKKGYAPYSNYKVGAALMTDQYEMIQGTNVENASYGLTCCAERSAIFRALSDEKKNFEMIAVVTRDGGAPCGACRQVLYEFNPLMWVIMATEDGQIVHECSLSELLPQGFGPQNLND